MRSTVIFSFYVINLFLVITDNNFKQATIRLSRGAQTINYLLNN